MKHWCEGAETEYLLQYFFYRRLCELWFGRYWVLTVVCACVLLLGGLRGASIIDSLDTLYIMGLMDEYNDAKEWVKTSLDLNSVRSSLLTPLFPPSIYFTHAELQGGCISSLIKISAVAVRAGSITSVAFVF